MDRKTKANLIRFAALSIFVILVISPARAQQVTYNYMPGTDFSKYHTFKWIEIPSNVHPNQIVAYQCTVDQERQWSAWGMGGGLRWGGIGTATSSTITNGMLAVDFYDPTSQQLIWRGSAAQTLNPSGNQEKNVQKLNKGVSKLLKHFPPQA